MATIEELLSANLPVVPSLPFRTAQPTTKPEIQAARAELEPYQRAGESGRQQSQMIAEALRTRQRQIGEQAASAREKGLLEIEAKRPIPKELPAFDAPKKTFDELFSVIMVGAMTAAGAGKGNYLAAANSMIGAMEGYQKGKKTEFDQALREFDTSLKKALQEEKVNNARYQQIAASDKLSLAEKVRQIQIQATALDDKIMSATARSNDFEKMTREIARRNEGFAKIEDARNRAEESLKNQMEMRRFGAELTAATRQPREEKLYMATGPDGKPAMVRVTVDESGVAKAPEGYTLTGEAAGRRGRGAEPGQNARTFASRVFGNIQNAGQDLKNIAALPATSTTPILSGLINADPNTITGSLVSAGARRITDQEKRAFDQLSQQLGAALSRIEGQGLASASTKQTIQTFDALRPKAGDSAINMALYLAKVKQEIETGISVHEEMFGATQGQMNKNKKMSEDLDKLIPFNVDTVIDVVRKNRIPLSDSSMRLLRAAPIAQNIQYMGMRPTEDVDRVSGQPSAPSGPAASRAPEGVPQEVWNAMTPQERALWPR